MDQEDYARLMQHADIPSDDRYTHNHTVILMFINVTEKQSVIFSIWELKFLMRLCILVLLLSCKVRHCVNCLCYWFVGKAKTKGIEVEEAIC